MTAQLNKLEFSIDRCVKKEDFMSDLIPKHGGFRKLRSFQTAQKVYDGTVVFCKRFVSKFSRTNDQMVQTGQMKSSPTQ